MDLAHVSLAGLALLLAAGAGAAPDSDHAPREWLAFVARTGAEKAPPQRVIEETPLFLLFRDGRAVWRDEQKPIDPDRRDPGLWREGRVDRRALAAFLTSLKGSAFFTAQPRPPDVRQPPSQIAIADLSITQVGVSAPGQSRIVRISSLDHAVQLPGAAYEKSAAAMRQAILALKPAESHRCEPPAIRVGLYAGGPGSAIDWPLRDRPALTAGNRYTYYSGADAKAVVAALARSTLIRANGQALCAEWAPALDVPQVIE